MSLVSLLAGNLASNGRPRDTPLPWSPDLGALALPQALDAELAEIMNKIMEDTLNLNSASDVTFVCKAKSFKCGGETRRYAQFGRTVFATHSVPINNTSSSKRGGLSCKRPEQRQPGTGRNECGTAIINAG
jgi:hypothetical protein